MKYINFRIGLNNTVELDIACSHGDCTRKLKGDENFCPKCGSKLKKLPDHFDKEAIITLINENIDKLLKQPKVEPKANLNDPRSITVGPGDHGGANAIGKEVIVTCPHGKGFPSVCGLCTGKGACTFEAFSSLPPMYKMCPFRGSGFIRCSEAE